MNVRGPTNKNWNWNDTEKIGSKAKGTKIGTIQSKLKKKNKWGSSNIADLQAQRAPLSILTMQGRCWVFEGSLTEVPVPGLEPRSSRSIYLHSSYWAIQACILTTLLTSLRWWHCNDMLCKVTNEEFSFGHKYFILSLKFNVLARFCRYRSNVHL